MIHPPIDVILLSERSYSEQIQSPAWFWGYDTFGKPADQMFSSNGYYGFPMLHAGKGSEKFAYFNYLFVDGHVQLLNPKQTVRDKNTLLQNQTWEGGDFMWTILPYKYKN
jgi:prepilin-type processing-associated H-X9-DG protein